MKYIIWYVGQVRHASSAPSPHRGGSKCRHGGSAVAHTFPVMGRCSEGPRGQESGRGVAMGPSSAVHEL